MHGEEVAAGPGKGAAAGEECQQHNAVAPEVAEAAGFHDAANLFPLMDEPALAELADDIVEHGLREPIWRHRDGRIIDGRNRWLACANAGVECRHRTYEKGDDTIVRLRGLEEPVSAAPDHGPAGGGCGRNREPLSALPPWAFGRCGPISGGQRLRTAADQPAARERSEPRQKAPGHRSTIGPSRHPSHRACRAMLLAAPAS